MGSVVSALTGGDSGNSGSAGINYRADQANITNPVTQAQIDASIQGVGGQQQQQQQLLQALQAQNGIQNQSNVFGQLQGVANGTGPNPAQAMLAQSTGANTANQAALMAGQRGSSANVGLMARQAAQQGSQNQQQAAGQAATMQAQQSLGAIQGMGNLSTQMVGQQMGQQAQNAGYEQAQEGQLLGAQSNYNSAQTGSQASVNQANSMIANNVASQQGKMVGNLFGGAAGMVTGLLAKGGKVGDAPKMADGGMAPSAPPPPTIQSAGTGPTSRVGKFMHANFGTPSQQQAQQGQQQPSDFDNGYKAGNQLGTKLKGYMSSDEPAAVGSEGYMPDGSYNDASQLPGTQDQSATGITGEAGTADIAGEVGGEEALGDLAVMAAAHGGKVPALLSPGERYLSPKDVKQVEKGANPMKEGKKIPGTPKVKGAKNSYANDTVKASLDEGGIVLPRSVTQHKNPEWAAHAFVRGIMAKNRQGLKK